jgi:uncharacterized protein (TIGR02246 family)
MVRTLTSILALLLVHSAFGGLAHAQMGNSSAPPEAVVKELSKQWSTAIITKDGAILERIWAADFVSVGPSGQRFTKAQEIAALKASKEKVTVSEVTSLDVRVYGNGTVAVDIGEYHESGTDEERKPYERRSRFTNVWVLRDGSWKCVSGHASTLEPKR